MTKTISCMEIREPLVCDYCKDTFNEDSFTHLSESYQKYYETLCDTCFNDHQMYDTLNL